jgi:NAD(P)-dependent dehydrogenase (short-subunit alcohol dehydrogenase family)
LRGLQVKLEGAAAVVVGGASGMGRATAGLLSARGARVAVLDRPGSDGPEVAAALGGVFHACDITELDGAESALAASVLDLGALHVAVNTAGGGVVGRVLSKSGPHDIDTFRRVIELNVVAPST